MIYTFSIKERKRERNHERRGNGVFEMMTEVVELVDSMTILDKIQVMKEFRDMREGICPTEFSILRRTAKGICDGRYLLMCMTSIANEVALQLANEYISSICLMTTEGE